MWGQAEDLCRVIHEIAYWHMRFKNGRLIDGSKFLWFVTINMRTKQGKRTYFFLTFSMSLPGIATSSKLDSSELRGAVRTNSSGCVLFADTFEIKSAASSTLNAKRVCVSQTNRPIFAAGQQERQGNVLVNQKLLRRLDQQQTIQFTNYHVGKYTCTHLRRYGVPIRTTFDLDGALPWLW